MYIDPEKLYVYVVQARPKTGMYPTWKVLVCPINGLNLYSDRQEAIDAAVDFAKEDSRHGYRATCFSLKRILAPLIDTFMELPEEAAE